MGWTLLNKLKSLGSSARGPAVAILLWEHRVLLVLLSLSPEGPCPSPAHPRSTGTLGYAWSAYGGHRTLAKTYG